jgi:hypothetical protein
VRAASFAVACVVTFASSSAAQRPSERCTPPDTSADWYRRQRAWLSEAAPASWANDSLRATLVVAAGVDTAHALPAQLGAALVDPGTETVTQAAAAALAQLKQLARDRQSPWPTRSVVGPAGFRAAWLIAQRDTALLRTALHRMMEAGPEESLPADVALLEDRIRVQSGRKQLYGTQLRRVGAALVPAPMEDSAHVDMRRDAAGLPPLRIALCSMTATSP